MEAWYVNQQRIREEFIKAHGGHDSKVPYDDGNFHLFPDGARMSTGMFGEVIEPPEDERKRLKLVVTYHEIRVRAAEDKFAAFKAQVLATFDEGSRRSYAGVLYNGTEEEAVAELHALRLQVNRTRSRWQDAKKTLEERTGPTPEQRRSRAASDREIAEKKSKFLKTVSKVKV